MKGSLWLRRLLRDARDFRALRRRRLEAIEVRFAFAGGAIDGVRVFSDGTISVEGWSTNLTAFGERLRLERDGRQLGPTHVFRTRRPDVEHAIGNKGLFGAVGEFITDDPGEAVLSIADGPRIVVRLPHGAATHYATLRNSDRVLGRQEIYASGPPSPVISAETLTLARRLPPPVLDVGCGSGALVAALRAEGIEAYGLELQGDRIETALLPSARPYVTLYDGSVPLPYAERSFESVVCAEVLEHIVGFEAVIAELYRVARTAVLVTVPDCSAIPRGHAHFVVPWHLLESTHVNFFNQHSLEQCLREGAASIEFARVGEVRCDSMSFYTSLAAFVSLQRQEPPARLQDLAVSS